METKVSQRLSVRINVAESEALGQLSNLSGLSKNQICRVLIRGATLEELASKLVNQPRREEPMTTL